MAFAASRSQSFFVISSAAAKQTIVDPAEHARSIQKKPAADLWSFRRSERIREAQASCLRSPETIIPLAMLKKYVRNLRQAQQHGWSSLFFVLLSVPSTR